MSLVRKFVGTWEQICWKFGQQHLIIECAIPGKIDKWGGCSTLENLEVNIYVSTYLHIYDIRPGVQKSFHPTIPDGSTWSKFEGLGEHG